MANLKAVAVLTRRNFLYTPAFKRDDGKTTPERDGGAAAVLALVTSGKGDRMFLHLARHTNSANVSSAPAHFMKTGLNPVEWVEVNYRRYTASGTLISLDGEVFKNGWESTSDDGFDADTNTTRLTALKPQVERWPNHKGFKMRVNAS